MRSTRSGSTKVCVRCEFPLEGRQRKYCSDACKRARKSDYDRVYKATRVEERAAAVERWNTRHPGAKAAYDRARRARMGERLDLQTVAWRRANPERASRNARNSVDRRRARLLSAPVVPFTPAAESARWDYFGGKCWMCGVPAVEWDHVKPLSRGGAHMLSNMRPACRSCNARKSNRWPVTG